MPSPKPGDTGIVEDVLSWFTSTTAVKTAQDPSFSKKRTPKELLQTITAKLGKEWVVWEPETIWTEIKRRFATLPGEPVRNKIQAARVLLTSESFWKDHWVFEKVVMAFNNHVPVFNEYQRPSSAMIARGVRDAASLRKLAYSDEIRRYVALVAFLEGMVALPEPLDFAQDELNDMTSYTVTRDFRNEVQSLWNEMNKRRPGRYTESAVDIQLARMTAIREYLRAS